jgi:hypothetical protein
MASPKRLVLFVEGPGDQEAIPVLVKKLLTDMNAWSDLFLDKQPPFKVGNVAGLTKDNGRKWVGFLKAAAQQANLGAVLLIQDGDLGRIRGEEFCAARFATRLSQWAKGAGVGNSFSVATVFACQEFESWILACAEHLEGVPFPDGRAGICIGTKVPEGDLENAPRDAKSWFHNNISSGYQPTRDQVALTKLMVQHLDAVRARGMRSFKRLENALSQLVNAAKTNNHLVTCPMN